ncbi:MAG: hypothetical protein IKE89_01025 [Bacilli bacterium]|nr:hypothetical protein [Bacilli bacterium]
MEEKKKSNAGLIVLVVILLLACVGMGAFIFINKDAIFNGENGQTIINNKDNSKKEKATKCPDISYDLNTNEYGLSENEAGIAISIDKTRKNVTISYNAATVSQTFSLGWFSGADTTIYEIIDTKTFDKKITQVLIDGSGQDVSSMAILYLMEDGTVEYVPLLKDINDNWGQQDNTKKVNSYGKLEGVSDIVSLISAEADGYHTVLARKADGTVINLSDAFRATGNF